LRAMNVANETFGRPPQLSSRNLLKWSQTDCLAPLGLTGYLLNHPVNKRSFENLAPLASGWHVFGPWTKGVQARSVVLVLRWLFLLALLACSVDARPERTSLKQIQETIVQVRTAGTVNLRADAAYCLGDMTRQIDSQDVDDKTFADLVSLMDSPDDSVRGGVAAALGFLGERAKPAIPKLLEILPKVDCLNGAMTSADAIRLALKRMGVTPPPRPCCQRYGA
jgi:hypothetical protein